MIPMVYQVPSNSKPTRASRFWILMCSIYGQADCPVMSTYSCRMISLLATGRINSTIPATRATEASNMAPGSRRPNSRIMRRPGMGEAGSLRGTPWGATAMPGGSMPVCFPSRTFSVHFEPFHHRASCRPNGSVCHAASGSGFAATLGQV